MDKFDQFPMWLHACDDLTDCEKIIYIRLRSLCSYSEGNSSNISDKKIAEQINKSERTVQRAIKRLEELGYVKRITRQTTSALRTRSIYVPNFPEKILSTVTDVVPTTVTDVVPTTVTDGDIVEKHLVEKHIVYNNVDSNEYDESDGQLELIPELATEAVAGTEGKIKAKEKQLQEDFEKLWKLYPNKKGKTAAFKGYKKAIKDGVTNKEIRTGIVAYKKQIAINHTEKQYIKHGSTFFNQRCWEDEDLKLSTKVADEPKQQETTEKVSEVTPDIEAALFKNYYN